MNWYDQAHTPPEKLVHAADIRSDPVSAFQAENDRRLPSVKCLPDLGGGGRYRSVGALCCRCDLRSSSRTARHGARPHHAVAVLSPTPLATTTSTPAEESWSR